jgi:eukaryotic-like serine/threonine-protein kinase
MSHSILLTVTKGPLQGQSWTFEAHDSCLIGRHRECRIRLPDDAAHKTVSRHHALLELAPPQARIRDFGSLNGTFVNGQKIGARPQGQSLTAARAATYPERDLSNHDQIRIGDTIFTLEVRAQENEAALPFRETELASLADYELDQELGRGGMGQVFLARHKATGGTFALKVMLPRTASDAHSRTVFLREIALARSLSHPHVVAMHEYGLSEGKFFFTLDYCELGNLNDWMQNRHRSATPGEAIAITLQVLQGLEYLSQVPVSVRLKDGSEQAATGLVHRDLSPQNILLTQRANGKLTAKIADVGLGKAFETAGLSGLTLTGHASGKPIFMPRQQVVDYKFATPEVDVWAAAATLYFLLTGYYPRDFPPRCDPWKVVLSDAPIPIRERDAQVPALLAEVIDRALRDQPGLHYQSARALSADLRAALRELGMMN